MARTELAELVERPNETLSAEYKSWLDLTNHVDRANLARHLAALSNHGGGYVVMGFEDDMTPSDPTRGNPDAYTRDAIAAISRKYLEPALQCDVQMVTRSTGTKHPVIIVPPHGATPICAKANGPEVERRIVGITQGVYYTRKAGPESAPIISAAEWHPIIRRCAMHDRSAILGALNAALQVGTPAPDLAADIKRWADAAYEVYTRDASAFGDAAIARHCVQYSYGIGREDGERLPVEQLLRVIEEVNREVPERVRTGWSMFYPFTREPIAPYFETDARLIDGEFLECRLMREPDPRHTDMWRVAPTGLATLIRPYWEDDPEGNAFHKWQPRSWVSPFYQYRALAEIVRHAQGVAERFSAPTVVSFRCQWRGLKGRQIADPQRHWSPGRVANSDERTTTGSWPVSAMETEWPEIVASLGAPMIRAFATDLNLGPDFVRSHAAEWKRM